MDALKRVLDESPAKNSMLAAVARGLDGPLNDERIDARDPSANARHINEVARFFEAEMVEIQPGLTEHGNGDGRDLRLISVGRRLRRRGRLRGAEEHLRRAEATLISCLLAAYIRELGYWAKGELPAKRSGRVVCATVMTDLPLGTGG